jgi:DNA-binding MarR family transcriptional regulator
MKRYSLLWNEKQAKPFDYDEARKILHTSASLTSVILSEIRKAEWLRVEIDPEDTRKRIYVLTNPMKAIESMGKPEK